MEDLYEDGVFFQSKDQSEEPGLKTYAHAKEVQRVYLVICQHLYRVHSQESSDVKVFIPFE